MVLDAPNVASSRNLGKLVVAVAAVLGSNNADMLVTPSLVTRGMKASRFAQHKRSPREALANNWMLPNKRR